MGHPGWLESTPPFRPLGDEGGAPGSEVMPRGARRVERVRFAVVPDAITTALELEKGSADAESNAMTLDERLGVAEGGWAQDGVGAGVGGGVCMNFNVTDPVLRDKRVRQAVACAIDRRAIMGALWHGAGAWRRTSLLPPWDTGRGRDDAEMARYPHDVPSGRSGCSRRRGSRPGKDGVRIRITLKTSTDETTRLMAAVLQQQMREAGIALADPVGGVWDVLCGCDEGERFRCMRCGGSGSNEDPDIFPVCVWVTESMPPKGGQSGAVLGMRGWMRCWRRRRTRRGT